MKHSIHGALYVGFLIAASSVQAVAYTITDLGTLGNGYSYSYGHGVNNSGQVTGGSFGSGVYSQDHAFLYSGGTMQDLGSLGSGYAVGYSLNDSGQVAGYSITTEGNGRAFLYSGGTMQDLGTLGSEYTISYGYDINTSGQVTGYSTTPGGDARAFLYSGGTMQDLGTLGGTASHGYGVNDSGQVAGESRTSGNSARHAFLYDGSAMQDLGTLGGTDSTGQDINNSGQVTGYSDTSGGYVHAFLYDGSAMQDLGTLGGTNSYGRGLNDSGQVVGWSYTNSGDQAAFWYDGSTMLDLCVLVDCVGAGWDSLTYAVSISDNGYITGYGKINGELRAFLVNVSAVPMAEDATMSAISGTPSILDLSPYITDESGNQDLSTLTISSAATNGVAVSNGDGTVTYTSNIGFSGSDAFGYTVDDAFGQTSNEGTVSVTVSQGIPPIADPGGPYTGIVGNSITFDGRGSSDLDGRVVSYEWDFGDGNTDTGFKPKHTYAYGGFYTVTLRVTDNDGDISLPATTIATILYVDGDSDNDGLPDDVEDTNGNGNVEPGETDPFNADTDGDGLTDGFEVNVLGSDPISTTTLLPGDMNNDGDVNLGDLLLLQRQLLGYPSQ